MKYIESSSELISLLCSAAGAGAYGWGELSVSPKGGGEHMKLYKGGIVRVKAVVSASGKCGREQLISLADGAVKKLSGFSSETILRICSPYPAVIAKAENNGFIRIEKDIEVIYRGVC